MKKFFKYTDVPEGIKEQIATQVSQSPYRQAFHIEAPSGYLNDPNGFSFFAGKYHLFYQWTPFKYSKEKIWYQGWHHLVSDDLISWQSLGPGIEPDTIYETHGAYSGSGLSLAQTMLLFYTGNTRNQQGQRIPYQLIATMDSQGCISKRAMPEISGTLSGYTDHFRDPKLWRGKNGDFYGIIGVQREDRTGAALVVHSKDTNNWQVLGELGTKLTNFGYMWECPDYFELADCGVFIFSPQGILPEKQRFQNIYQTGYLIGSTIDEENLNLDEQQEFRELDKGFDFYAPQSTELPDGRRIVIGWMGLPEMRYPTEDFGYCGCLTIPRELTIVAEKLYQQPVREIIDYRKRHQTFTKTQLENGVTIDQTCELLFEINQVPLQDFTLKLMGGNQQKEYLQIRYLSKTNELWLDRSNLTCTLNSEYGTKRLLAKGVSGSLILDIFVDVSSIEIFVNQGEAVASSRMFFKDEQRFLRVTSGERSSVMANYWLIELEKN